MIGFSQGVAYGIRALSCLAMGICETRFVRDIASCADVPPAYLSKLFTRLAQKGIIRTKRGWKGGIHLARPAETISLLEIVVAIEGDRWIADCLLGLDGCEAFVGCPTHAFWQEERRRIEAELSRTTLADVAGFERARRKPGDGGCACGSETQPAGEAARSGPS